MIVLRISRGQRWRLREFLLSAGRPVHSFLRATDICKRLLCARPCAEHLTGVLPPRSLGRSPLTAFHSKDKGARRS